MKAMKVSFPANGMMRSKFFCWYCSKFTMQIIDFDEIEYETQDNVIKHYIAFFHTCHNHRDDDGVYQPKPKRGLLSLSEWNRLCDISTAKIITKREIESF